jgi:hypothetical protein
MRGSSFWISGNSGWGFFFGELVVVRCGLFGALGGGCFGLRMLALGCREPSASWLEFAVREPQDFCEAWLDRALADDVGMTEPDCGLSLNADIIPL